VNWETLNWLDLSIALVLFVSALVAFLSGLLRELVSIAALTLGLIIASLYYAPLAGQLGRWLWGPHVAAPVAFIGILILVWSFTGGVGLLFVHGQTKGGSDLGDRLLGFLFGLVKGLALATIVLMVLTVYLPAQNQAFRESHLYPIVVQGSRLFQGLLQPEERSVLMQRLDEISRPVADPVEGFV
jgi:membrane protein required for colicin V production